LDAKGAIDFAHWLMAEPTFDFMIFIDFELLLISEIGFTILV
jgi:hypothetical protein